MITISNADKALKTFYLGVLADQLNVGINPLFAKIGQTTSDVWGKEIKKLAPYGINGGIGAGQETDNLPKSTGNNYAQFTLTLKNLYGNIEISDKAIRASQNSAGAFVNLLNAEMDGLLKASKFNFGRMLYGDGSGVIAKTVEHKGEGNTHVAVDSAKGFVEGMVLDFYSEGSPKAELCGARCVGVDRQQNLVYLDKSGVSYEAGYEICLQGSRGNEITGLNALFGDSETLYGLKRSDYSFLKPYQKNVKGNLAIGEIQDAIDYVEENGGGTVDFIATSYKLRKQYVEEIAKSRMNVDYMTLDGGYKALSYSGIPFVADRFVRDGDMYILNTEDFKLHQLCDWRWLEGESGTVLHQMPGKACYSATLVKYADLMCERPMGQAKLTFDFDVSPVFYTVNFNSDGGSAVPSQYVAPGGYAFMPTANPQKDGKTFSKWVNNGAEYKFATTPVTQDITLDATYA